MTPFELFYGRKPNMQTIRAFGCPCYVHVHRADRDGRNSDTAQRGIFLGYNQERRAYNVLIQHNKIVVSRSVVFNEGAYIQDITTRSRRYMEEIQSGANDIEKDMDEDSSSEDEGLFMPWGTSKWRTCRWDTTAQDTKIHMVVLGTRNSRNRQQKNKQNQGGDEKVEARLKRLQRNLAIDMAHSIYEGDHAMVMVQAGVVPNTYKQVMEHPERDEWLAAVDRERQALERMNCFGPPVILPEGKKATTTGYLFVVKADGTKKARHVYKYTPFNGHFDSQETYSPVVDKAVLRMFFAEAMSRQMVIVQADATNAYINAVMDEEEVCEDASWFL
jgi:hypothetical protein